MCCGPRGLRVGHDLAAKQQHQQIGKPHRHRDTDTQTHSDTHTHTDTHTDTRTHTDTHMHTCTQTHTHTHTDRHTRRHTESHTCRHIYTHRHTCTQTHTQTHTRTHTDTHACAQTGMGLGTQGKEAVAPAFPGFWVAGDPCGLCLSRGFLPVALNPPPYTATLFQEDLTLITSARIHKSGAINTSFWKHSSIPQNADL